MELCSDAGVKLLYLPPYSPDLNPIEEFFAELKACEANLAGTSGQNFKEFLERRLDIVGSRNDSAQGRF
jgi:transposase